MSLEKVESLAEKVLAGVVAVPPWAEARLNGASFDLKMARKRKDTKGMEEARRKQERTWRALGK